MAATEIFVDELYVDESYVECGYFEGDCSEGLPEHVKVFGFSRNRVIKPDFDTDSKAIVDIYNSKFGRDAFAFPSQEIKAPGA